MNNQTNTTKTGGAMTVIEFLAWASISRPTFYREINEGRLTAHKLGHKTLVRCNEADRWLAALPTVETAPSSSQ